MENSVDLLTLNNSLMNYLDKISVKFDEVKESKEKGNFYLEVKPFADEVKEVNDKWKMVAIEWIKNRNPKNLHEKQIESAYEQIELLSVQAFYPDTSKTRFINYFQTVRFILLSINDQIEKK